MKTLNSFLIDSDVCMDAINRRDLSLIEALKRTANDRVAVSVIVHGEVVTGFLEPTRRNRDGRKVWHEFIAGIDVLEVTKEIGEVWGELRGFLRRAGLMTGDNDLLIAATALSYDMTVVTRNIRDFRKVPGLNFLSPVYW